ncbi:MAG: HAMP domain-containing histidine kinase [Coprobacillaceae bacterium]|nr:sensor histidine kinase [Coprobacillus sp. TF10-10]UYJ05285.1 MAG: HAMP domain-containing histidine kinase [Coprobacillaceae bacterium]
MKNKNRLLKILLFSVLIIASLVTYLSYGVKEKMTSTKLDFDNNRSRITEILTGKSILLDMKIQRRKGNYDLLHYYVKGDDIDQLNVYDDYSLKDVFKDYIYNLEDENNHETKGIKYYVYDKTDEKIFFTNSKKNLKNAFETQDKKVLNDYQWYTAIDYDGNGNVSLEGKQTSDWEGSFYNTSFDQLFKNNYLDEGNSNTINQITLKNPTNIKVLIAIPKKLPTNCYLEELCSKQGSISDVLVTYVFIIVAALAIFMLFVPVRKLIEIEPFKTVVKVKLFFMFFIYIILIEMWLAGMTEVLRASWQGTFAWMLRERGMAGAGVAIEPIINVGGWFVFYAMIMYFIFYIKSILVFGKDFIKEHTLVCSAYHYFKDEIKSLTQFDLKNQKGNIILKIGLISGICIEGILLFVYFFMGIIGNLYYISPRIYLIFTCFISLICAIIIMLISKKMLTQVTNDYQILLQSAHHLSQGEFNDKINQDLGLFNSLKDELNCINDGFKDAVSKEVASQKMKTELISNVSHDLKTPLTSIISYIDLLKNEDLSKEQQDEYIDILDRNTKRLKTLIEDLFEVSKVNSGNIQLNPIDLDIHALLQQVLFEYQEQFEHHHLNLKNDYENKKIICHLDSEKTYRVLENLCQNICKYALEHTRVYLQIVETNQQVIVVFKNISAHEISNSDDLTERFVQGDTSRKSEGSGLGLAICKSFVEVQGGTFEVNVDGDLFKTTIIFPKKIEND